MKPLSLSVFILLLLGFMNPHTLWAESKELVLWHSYRGKEKAALEEVCAKFPKPGWKVRLLPVPNDAYPDKITAAIPRGKGPDLFIFAHDRIGDWVESGLLEPLDFWADDAVTSQYLPQCLPPLRYKGSLYGLPMSFKCLSLFYNKKLVTTPPTTTKEFIEIAQKNTNSKKNRYGLIYESGMFYFNAPWIFGFGGILFDSNANLKLNTPAAAAALRFISDLQNKYKVCPVEVTNALTTTFFNRGDAAMCLNGPWFMAEINDTVDYGICPLPIINASGKPAKPFLTVEAALISSKSKNKEEAWELARYLTTGDASLEMVLKGKQLPADNATLQHKKVALLMYVQAFRQQLKNSMPTPNIPEMRMVWTPYNDAIQKVLNGAMTPEAALTQCQEKVQKDIQIYRK